MPAKKRSIDIVYEPVMRSPAMRELDRIVRAVGPKDVGVTIIGESGTGKEVFARRVHDLSERRRGPFVPINCAAIPEGLFESELFGHERGAFTGASELMRGKVEASAGGTLFLDEIGEMPLGVQAKMLRFLEHRKFMRVGGSTKISVDARLVCATLRPLEQEVKVGRFRADLYYRLQGVIVTLPPLRERSLDLPPLVQEFLAELSAKHSVTMPRISRAAMALFHRYAWPGNVRELKNTIELCCLLYPGKSIAPAHLPEGLRGERSDVEVPRSEGRDGGISPRGVFVSLDQPLSVSIRQLLEAAVALEGGNRSRAARRLGLSLRTLQRHLGPDRPFRR